MQDRVILIDKPPQMTSFGVVARLRRILSQQAGKKVKVGHCGTLDPFATGLLIIVTGKECRNAMNYTKLDKVYEATIRLGATSSTGDPEGEIFETSQHQPTLKEIKDILSEFTGEITQTPPIFSAIKINGQRAYKLAREGQVIEMPRRAVTVYSLDIIDYRYPLLKIRTHVSSGTYIRSLAIDIGTKLKTGAYCQELRRIKIDNFDVKDAQTLKDFGLQD